MDKDDASKVIKFHHNAILLILRSMHGIPEPSPAPPSPDQADDAWGSDKTDDEDARKYKALSEAEGAGEVGD